MSCLSLNYYSLTVTAFYLCICVCRLVHLRLFIWKIEKRFRNSSEVYEIIIQHLIIWCFEAICIKKIKNFYIVCVWLYSTLVIYSARYRMTQKIIYSSTNVLNSFVCLFFCVFLIAIMPKYMRSKTLTLLTTFFNFPSNITLINKSCVIVAILSTTLIKDKAAFYINRIIVVCSHPIAGNFYLI